jgi:predicted GNAT family N-acyltransferase
LAGVVGIRDHTHLYHLFVDKSAHEQGLGKQLWQVARDHCLALKGDTKFTVNSSNHALAFYQKLGFKATGPAFSKMGIVSTPMCLVATAG